jgi:glycosyltransferase involved in cell wall biosynthesis
MSNTSDTLPGTARTLRIAVVVSGWPRLSESFALNELLALHEAGMLAGIFATKQGDSTNQHPAVATLDSCVHHLGDGSAGEQAAEVWGALGGLHVHAVHGYFAHQPAAVARAAAALLGVRFGFSVHAKDARKVEPEELADRARAAACIVACNYDVAQQLRAVGADPILAPHGVDLDSFAPQHRDSTDGRIEILAVGRLVAKKGFDVLIDAMRLLDFDWRLRIVGDGPLLGQLQHAARVTANGDRIEFLGARSHSQLPSLYHAADMVVVPSVIDGDGDRDGLPNVVLEAMACGLAVVGSDVAAIPSAIDHRVTGLLVEPGDVHGLANAVSELAKDPDLRATLGANGRARAEAQFSLRVCTDRFLSILETAYG